MQLWSLLGKFGDLPPHLHRTWVAGLLRLKQRGCGRTRLLLLSSGTYGDSVWDSARQRQTVSSVRPPSQRALR